MPFFDFVGPGADDYSTVPKVTVTLTQQDSTSEKTSFTCDDAFGWSDSSPGVPPPDSRVEAGTPTDLASIPPFLWGLISSYGRHTMPAILHDVRCDAAAAKGAGGRAHGAYLRRRADQQFRHTLRVFAGKGVATRYVMWSAVRLFGCLPLGVAVLLGVVVGLLHLAGDLFVRLSAALGEVTTWRWLSWLDVVPQGIAWLLARAAEALRPDLPYRAIMAGLLVAAIALGVARSIERPSPGAPARLSVPALLSLVAATVVGVLSAPPLLPLVLVTIVTRLVLWILDLVLHGLEVLAATVLRGVAGVAPDAVTIPDSMQHPPRRPRFPGLFPKP